MSGTAKGEGMFGDPVNPTGPAGAPVPVATPNRSSFATNQKNVSVAGTAVQLQNQAIPDGFSIVVKAKKANTGVIRVGVTAAIAQSATEAFDLSDPKDFVRLSITNANLIWIDAAVSGEGVEWIVET